MDHKLLTERTYRLIKDQEQKFLPPTEMRRMKTTSIHNEWKALAEQTAVGREWRGGRRERGGAQDATSEGESGGGPGGAAPPPAPSVSSPAFAMARAGAGAAASRMALPGASLSSLMDASQSSAAAPGARTGGSATAALPVLPVAHSISVPNKMVISSMSNVLKFCNDASDCGAY